MVAQFIALQKQAVVDQDRGGGRDANRRHYRAVERTVEDGSSISSRAVRAQRFEQFAFHRDVIVRFQKVTVGRIAPEAISLQLGTVKIVGSRPDRRSIRAMLIN